jgi:hypothetical protein
MLEMIPPFLLIVALTVTLILLPRLHDDSPPRTGSTDEIRIPAAKGANTKRPSH